MNARKTVTFSIFIAITCLLQFLSTYINFIGFPITLSLIPIIIGGALYGIGFASALGLSFGVFVSLMVILGLDPSGATMFSMHPIITIGICLFKGCIAGCLSALVYKTIENKKVAIVVSSATATLANTISFLIVLYFFFDHSFSSVLSILLSVNFIIEFITNIVIAPLLLPIINKRRHKTI